MHVARLLAVLRTLRRRRLANVLELLRSCLQFLLEAALLGDRLFVALLRLAKSGLARGPLLGELLLEPLDELPFVSLSPPLLLLALLR